jgi:hypothetical protein
MINSDAFNKVDLEIQDFEIGDRLWVERRGESYCYFTFFSSTV